MNHPSIHIASFSPIQQTNTEKKNSEATNNIIINRSPLSVNEIRVCSMVERSIPHYANYFSLLEGAEELALCHDTLEKIKNKDHQFLLFRYHSDHSTDLLEYLYRFQQLTPLISSMVRSLLQLLEGFATLHEHGICFFDVSPSNIIYVREKPLLSRFRFSVILSQLDIPYLTMLLKYKPSDHLIYNPIELHLFSYMVQNKIDHLTSEMVPLFCDQFVKQVGVLRFFSDKYKQRFATQCVDTLQPYIHRPHTEVLNQLLERNDKWDVYGISILFIQILGCISTVFSLKNTAISKITLELVNNIHPDPDKRMTLRETLCQCGKLLDEQGCWKFVQTLDNHKLERLMEEFSQ